MPPSRVWASVGAIALALALRTIASAVGGEHADAVAAFAVAHTAVFWLPIGRRELFRGYVASAACSLAAYGAHLLHESSVHAALTWLGVLALIVCALDGDAGWRRGLGGMLGSGLTDIRRAAFARELRSN